MAAKALEYCVIVDYPHGIRVAGPFRTHAAAAVWAAANRSELWVNSTVVPMERPGA